ncbi:MAG: cation diffusion facilitator family transporter [Candidatus Omnitrophica bacterium]|nr:cation diffusion facilitator family transporter [Candidatus Omnitrophota bacterium]
MPNKRMCSSSEVKRLQMRAVKVSITGSVILFLIAASVGIAVDSITLILDATANLIILAVAILMNHAIKKIHKPADEMYNFGYGKYEPLTAFLQGVLILATCVFAMKFAIQDIIHREDLKDHLLPVVSTFGSGILGVFIVLYLKRLAERTGSAMLKVAGLHWHMDTVLSFGICFGFFIGLTLERMGYHRITPYVDPVMAMVLALSLVRDPIKTVTHNVLELLDAAPRGNVHGRVRKVVDTCGNGSLGVHRIRARKAGEKIFLDVIFSAKDNLSLVETEDLADRLEKGIRSELGNCDVVICFKKGSTGARS